MVLFLYGSDTYRSSQKLRELVANYRKIHRNSLGIYDFDFSKDIPFSDFEKTFFSQSLLDEKRLFVLRDTNLNKAFKGYFLKNQKRFLDTEDIIVFFEKEISGKDKLFQLLKKNTKSQVFEFLTGENLRQWAQNEFEKENIKIQKQALAQLVKYTGSDLWRLSGEIRKLILLKKGEKPIQITPEDVQVFVKPQIDLDIFQTLDFLAQRDRKRALSLLCQHIEKGDAPLYLLTLIAFQFRNLLLVKEKYLSLGREINIFQLAREINLPLFVVQKILILAQKFSFEELKQMYQKIFQIDVKIKTGKIDPQAALEIFISET